MTDPDVRPYDPFAPETLADPFAAHSRLRAECPVHFHPDFGDRGFYSAALADDVTEIFTDVDRWSGDWGQGPIYVKEGGLRSDPPEHTIYRRLVTSAFTVRRVNEWEPMVRATADELIDAFADRGSADLCSGFAVPFPIMVISKILGVPTDRLADFKEWSDEFMAGQNAADPEVQGRARAKIDEFFRAELGRRRALVAAAPPDAEVVGAVLPDDVLTSLLLAEHDGRPFTDEQLLPLLLLLLVGGNETTTSMIGNLVGRLLDLDAWESTAASPDTWDIAIEESLRFDPPVMGMFRTAKGDQELRGVTIPDECKIEALIASANRDPARFDDPDTFRLDRDLDTVRRNHLSLGAGIWFCPGAALARLEGRVAIESFARRLPGLRRDGAGERVASFMMWGPQTLPVTWDRAST